VKNLLVLLTIPLSAYASAAKLELKQELSGLDIAVAMVPGDPNAIKISNKTTLVVTCRDGLTGADAGQSWTVTVQPGKYATLAVPGNYADMPRSAELKCAEKQAKKK
jgi:hypothetical protein